MSLLEFELMQVSCRCAARNKRNELLEEIGQEDGRQMTTATFVEEMKEVVISLLEHGDDDNSHPVTSVRKGKI